ncbi:MAG: Minf_1886 family protein [Limisphaerales bacterium]
MQATTFEEGVEALVARDPRYHRDAYHFLRESLDFTQREVVQPGRPGNSHVTAAELLEGTRRHALQAYGPMALAVLNEWGVFTCEDIGHLVHRLVEQGCFSVTDGDRLEDFRGGYGFEEAFVQPYRPRGGGREEGAATVTTGR